MDVKKEKKIIFSILFVIFAIILFLSFSQTKIDNTIQEQGELIKSIKLEAQKNYLDKYIQQAKWVAEAYRNGIRNRIEEENIKLLKEINGNIVYRSLKETGETKHGNKLLNGEELVFNPDTMERFERHDLFYDIYDKKTGELLLEKTRPIWNREKLKKLFNETGITYLRMGGKTSDPIILDPISGELALDNSKDCETIPRVVRFDKKGNFLFRDIYLDHLHTNASYPAAMEWSINNKLTWRRDGKQIYYFSVEDGKIPIEDVENGQVWNLEKYPLGEYKREFQYQVIIPSEVLGLQGTNSQLTLILGMQEPEITNDFEYLDEQYKELKSNIKKLENLAVNIPRAIVILSIISLIIMTFALRNTYARLLQ